MKTSDIINHLQRLTCAITEEKNQNLIYLVVATNTFLRSEISLSKELNSSPLIGEKRPEWLRKEVIGILSRLIGGEIISILDTTGKSSTITVHSICKNSEYLNDLADNLDILKLTESSIECRNEALRLEGLPPLKQQVEHPPAKRQRKQENTSHSKKQQTKQGKEEETLSSSFLKPSRIYVQHATPTTSPVPQNELLSFTDERPISQEELKRFWSSDFPVQPTPPTPETTQQKAPPQPLPSLLHRDLEDQLARYHFGPMKDTPNLAGNTQEQQQQSLSPMENDILPDIPVPLPSTIQVRQETSSYRSGTAEGNAQTPSPMPQQQAIQAIIPQQRQGSYFIENLLRSDVRELNVRFPLSDSRQISWMTRFSKQTLGKGNADKALGKG